MLKTVRPLLRRIRSSRQLPLRLLVTLATLASPLSAAGADDYGALFDQTLRHPKDSRSAYAFVRASEERHDYEAAIGTLERLLFFDNAAPEIQARLGLLYYQLKSYDMASDYVQRALANPRLDDATRDQLVALQTQTAKVTSDSRFTGFVQTGLRYQSNASFNPDSNIIRLAGQDYAISHPLYKGGDGNAFVLSQIQHNLDLGNQRGDSVETILNSYYGRQFRLPDLSVGFVDGSIGPRLAIDTALGSGWTWKPYVVGGQVWLGAARYLSSFGAGTTADLPLTDRLALQPGVEVRRNLFSNVSAFSSLATGTAVSATLAASVRLSENVTGLARVVYSRGTSANAYQTYRAISEDVGLVGVFASPIPWIATRWSVSPYMRFTQTGFDGPNPFIDPLRAERDSEITAGLTIDTPLAANLGFATTIQFSRVASNIPNFAARNVSVLSGPVLRF